jgi:hypothetical protein
MRFLGNYSELGQKIGKHNWFFFFSVKALIKLNHREPNLDKIKHMHVDEKAIVLLLLSREDNYMCGIYFKYCGPGGP